MSNTELGKRKREAEDEVPLGEGGGEEDAEVSVADDLLLEELIGGADASLDAAGAVGAEGGDAEEFEGGEEDPSQIDLMAREILEDSQSQGTGYGPASKKPRRHFLAAGGEAVAAVPAGKGAAKRKKAEEEEEDLEEESLGEEDEEDEEEDEEVEVVEENDEAEEEDDDAFLEGGASKGTRTAAALRSRMRREEEGREEDEEDDEDEEGDEEDEGDGREFKALGAKGLYGMKNGGRGKGRSPNEDEEEGDEEEEAEDSEEEDEEDDDEDKPSIERADIDRYLDVNAKMGLLSRAARQLNAQSQVSAVLTTALLQLAGLRRDFLDEVLREIDVAKAEDYDSDDETEEKVELAEEETLDACLANADEISTADVRESYLAEHLEVPFKAKLNGERCLVVEAVGAEKLLVKQFGDSIVTKAGALTGVRGRNAAFLAEWIKHYGK